MKKRFLFLAGLLLFVHNGFAQINTKVDERFELTSITFALAGVPEYCDCGIPQYWKDIRDGLRAYELTDPIHFVRELNQVHRIGYNAVPSLAVMLKIEDGEIRLRSDFDISKIDSRWNEKLVEKYVEHLNVFYKESDFNRFFEEHKELYELAEKRMNEHISNTATGWFNSFFGRELDSEIKVYISLANGPHNYAMFESILIGVMGDKEGLPAPNRSTTKLLIHELGHHYTNSPFDSYWEAMKDAADRIYPIIKNKMAANAYVNARTSMLEWLNNLFVLMYYREAEGGIRSEDVVSYMQRGFIWMDRSVKFMENFYADRNLYPHIEDFMPQLVSFLNDTADDFDHIEQEYENSLPYIIDISPAPGMDITDADKITITFSEPMLGAYAFNGAPDGTEILPCSSAKWADNKRELILYLIPNKIMHGHTYGIKLKPAGFISTKSFWMNENYTDLIFIIEAE